MTVHRSNDRYLVKISNSNLCPQTSDIIDPDIKPVETKRGPKIQGHQRTTNKTYRVLHENYKDIYNTDICLGTFYTLLHISTHKQKDGDVLM